MDPCNKCNGCMLPNIRIKMFDSHIMNLPVTFWCKEKLYSYFNQTHRARIKGCWK